MGGSGSEPTISIFNYSGEFRAILGTYEGTFNGYSYGNNLPTTPVILNPSNGSVLYANNVNITWNQSIDLDGHSITYHYQLANQSNFSSIVNQSNITQNYTGNMVTSDGVTYFTRVRAYDGYNYSDWSSTIEFLENTAPSIVNVSISPTSPTTTDNLTVSSNSTDDDGHSITTYYRWYKNDTLQPVLNDSTVIVFDNTTDGETWKVGVIPYDGYENGTETFSATVTIGSGNSAPTLTGITSNLTSQKYNKNVTISTIDAYDAEGDNYTLHVGSTSGASDLCNSTTTLNGTEATCEFTIPWTSGSHTIYGRLTDGTDTSVEYSVVITVDTTPPVIGTTSVSPTQIVTGGSTTITANVTVANGSISYVYANVLTPDLTRSNYTMSYDDSNYVLVYSTSMAGTYQVDYYASDDSNNTVYKAAGDTFTVVTGEGGRGGGGSNITVNETVLGDLALTPPVLDTYFFYTALNGSQTAVYKFISNREIEQCVLLPNHLSNCSISEGYIVRVTIDVNDSTDVYIGNLTVLDEYGFVANSKIIVRVVNLMDFIPIVHIPLGGFADSLLWFFAVENGSLIGIRWWFVLSVVSLFGIAFYRAF
jgi:hypothetical protein